MNKSDEIVQEIKLIDNRINTYNYYLHLWNSGQIAITDRTTEIDLLHYQLEYEKEQEGKDEQ